MEYTTLKYLTPCIIKSKDKKKTLSLIAKFFNKHLEALYLMPNMIKIKKNILIHDYTLLPTKDSICLVKENNKYSLHITSNDIPSKKSLSSTYLTLSADIVHYPDDLENTEIIFDIKLIIKYKDGTITQIKPDLTALSKETISNIFKQKAVKDLKVDFHASELFLKAIHLAIENKLCEFKYIDRITKHVLSELKATLFYGNVNKDLLRYNTNIDKLLTL